MMCFSYATLLRKKDLEAFDFQSHSKETTKEHVPQFPKASIWSTIQQVWLSGFCAIGEEKLSWNRELGCC